MVTQEASQKLQRPESIRRDYYRTTHLYQKMERKQLEAKKKKLKERQENEESNIEKKGIWKLIKP